MTEEDNPPRRLRVLLDTMSGRTRSLSTFETSSFLYSGKAVFRSVIAGPATLIEVAETNDPDRRASILRLVAEALWRRGRLAPEIVGQADELVLDCSASSIQNGFVPRSVPGKSTFGIDTGREESTNRRAQIRRRCATEQTS